MSLEAVRDLSIQDLLRAVNEKLCLEYTRIRDTPTCSVLAVSLESEVSTHQPVLAPTDVTVSDPGGPHRSTVSTPLHAIF